MALRILNNTFTKNGVTRTVGALFPLDECSITFQVYFDTTREGLGFRTAWFVSKVAFDGNDYLGVGAGNGGTSNNWMVSSGGNDTYHGSLKPAAGRWYRQVFRRRKRAAGDYEQLYYFDVPTADFVSRDSTFGFPEGSQADNRLYWGAVPHTVNEGIDGRMCNMMVFKGALPFGFLFKQTQSWQLVDSGFRGALWAQYRGATSRDIRDLSGHGRHLTAVEDTAGDVSGIAHAPSLLSWRERPAMYDLDADLVAAGDTLGMQGMY